MFSRLAFFYLYRFWINFKTDINEKRPYLNIFRMLIAHSNLLRVYLHIIEKRESENSN